MVDRKLSFYEKICKVFGKVKIKPPKQLREEYEDQILFCHLQLTPKEVFSTAILFPVIIFIISYLIFHFLGLMSNQLLGILIIFTGVLFYFFLNYTKFLSRLYRSKASSEMVLAITYMAIAMRISHNLEKAIEFAAKNLTGPLGLDFKEIYWKLRTGEIRSAEEAIDEISRKWRSESQEFVDALSLLKISIVEPPGRAERTISEAVQIILNETRDRLKEYVIEMRTPLKMINAFGVLMPLLVMIFLPMIGMFAPELITPASVVVLYDFVLPFILYMVLSQYVYSKSSSYHQIEKERIKGYSTKKQLAFLISLSLFSLSLYFLFKLSELDLSKFNDSQFNLSLISVVLLGLSIALNYIIRSFGYKGMSKDLMKIEDEIPNFLMQLSVVVKTGKPIEKSFEELLPRLKKFKIRMVVEDILSRIRGFGMTLDKAIIGEEGVINKYPSKMLRIALENITDMYRRGTLMLSVAVRTMQEFFDNLKEIDRTSNEVLSETTSQLEITASVLAPLSAGIVIGLVAIVINVMTFFAPHFENLSKFIGETATNALSIFGNMQDQMPFAFYQLSIGIYVIELSFILSWFVNEIKHGENEIEKMANIGKTILISVLVYAIMSSILYYGITGIINFSSLTYI